MQPLPFAACNGASRHSNGILQASSIRNARCSSNAAPVRSQLQLQQHARARAGRSCISISSKHTKDIKSISSRARAHVNEQSPAADAAADSGGVSPSAAPAAEYVSYVSLNSVQQQQQQQQQQGDRIEQLQLLTILQDSINSLQQQQQGQATVCLSQWCSSIQPLLHLLPLDALAGIATQLGQQQQQQQQRLQVPFVTDTAFLQTFSAAAAAAAAAAASNATPNPPQQQQQQQVLQQLLDILLWSTSQLSQQQQQQWQQQQWQQWQKASLDPTQQHQQQLQQQQSVRGNLITLLQTSVKQQQLLQANCQQLKQLLLVWGRLGVIPDEGWMGQWLAAARHCMSDMVIPFQQQQQQQQGAAAVAAAAYADLLGLLSALAAAKVKPAEAWIAAWQAAAMAAMAAAPNFSSSSSSSSGSLYLLLLHQLLHAVSFLQLQLPPEFWISHETLLQQQLLQFNAGQLLLLLQAHQQCGLRPSGVAVKYMAAQLQQRIQHCWQQQQQQGAARSSSSSSSEVLNVCCVLCGLSAWGVRLPMSSAAQLLVCLAAEKQQLPLAWLLQVSAYDKAICCLLVLVL
jgi:hypothetical protein